MTKGLAAILLFITTATLKGQNFENIDIYEAWKVVKNSDNNIVIAVIDDGVLYQHEDLQENFWENLNEIPNNQLDDDENGYADDIYGWNFLNNSNDVSKGGIGNWHGTPVNGIIGAIHNTFGVSGLCPNAKLMNIVKGNSIESIMQSLKYIYQTRKEFNETDGKKGAFIVSVNCSWGKDSLCATDYPNWCDLYDSLGREGVLVVSSVPNDDIDIDKYGDMPSTCESDFLITVTNSNQYDEKVHDAGYGLKSVDMAAPGENTYTTLNTGDYGYFGGTSAAAPYVTGVIGLLYSLPSEKFVNHIKQNPAEVALLVKSVLMEGTDKTPELKNITVSGGRLNAFNSLKLLCNYYGEQQLYENLFDPLAIRSIHPNPATENASITIESNSPKRVIISIFNINGKTMKSTRNDITEGIQTIRLDLSGITRGIYIVTVSSGNIKNSKKLVIY